MYQTQVYKLYRMVICLYSTQFEFLLLGLLCDLLWSDPDKDIVGWGENDRGVSFTFGQDVVNNFLRKHDLDLICRAHQVRSSILYIVWFLLPPPKKNKNLAV